MLPLLGIALLVFVLLLLAARGVRYAAEKALARSSNRSAATAIGRASARDGWPATRRQNRADRSSHSW